MLAQACFRLITQRAIRGRTWAGDLVEDSPGRIEDLRDNAARGSEPFVAIYCDEGDTDSIDKTLLSLYDPLTVTLVIECGSVGSLDVSANPNFPNASTTVTSLNATDSGTELQINMLARQAIDALTDARDVSPYAELWRQAGQVKSVRTLRGGPKDDERAPRVRYASEIIVIRVDLLAEPPRGANLADYPYWSRLLNVFSADEELAPIGNLIQAHFREGASGAPIPSWQIASKLLNAPRETIEALGIAPIPNQDDPAQKFESITTPDKEPFPFPAGFDYDDG